MRSQTLREHFGFPKEASLFSADCFGTKKEKEKNNSQLSCLHWCISTTVFKGVTLVEQIYNHLGCFINSFKCLKRERTVKLKEHEYR